MANEDAAFAEALPRARHQVYERLALMTTIIWVVGTLGLFMNYVPVTARPGLQIMVSMTLPMIPASLPWLFYSWLSKRVARRLVDEEATVDE